MRPVRQRILVAVACLSLLLCAAELTLWAMSQHRLDSISFIHREAGSGFRLVSSRGLIVLKRYEFTPAWEMLEPQRGHTAGPEGWFLNGQLAIIFCVEDIPPSEQGLAAALGFGRTHERYAEEPHTLLIHRTYLPHWLVCTALAALPLQQLGAWGARRRRQEGARAAAGAI
jgi:hypothetical protein